MSALSCVIVAAAMVFLDIMPPPNRPNVCRKAQLTQGLRATAQLRATHHSKMAASYHLGFYRTGTGNSAIRSADPENHNIEPNMEWIGCTVSEI